MVENKKTAGEKSDGKNTKKKPKRMPRKKWWEKAFEPTNVIALAVGVGLIIATLVATWLMNNNSTWQFHEAHRPKVIFSRPVELLKPLTCDPATGQGTASFRIWIKNIGDQNAESVLPIPMIQLIPDVPKGKDWRVEKVIDLARGYCTAPRESTHSAPGFPLYAGKEGSVDIPTHLGSSTQPGDRLMQAFIIALAVYYEEDGTPHKTVEIERLFFLDGTRSFVCGKPVNGQFDTYPIGSCSY
jgi:hypothetical protein